MFNMMRSVQHKHIRKACRTAVNYAWSSRAFFQVKCTSVVMVVCCTTFLMCLALKQHTYSEYLMRSLRGPLPFDDAELIAFIRNNLLVPPSTLPYNLEGVFNPALSTTDNSEVFYRNMSRKLFGNMTGGVFIEAGALDGETMSNTLRLEKKQGWSGLLVEADPVTFKKLKSKNRKAWILDACLSPHPYPSEEQMVSHSHYVGMSGIAAGAKMRAMHTLVDYINEKRRSNYWFKSVQCIPLQSLLVAMNLTHVDLLVLDVEGAELDVLRHLDLNKYKIDVIYLEWKMKPDHPEVVKNIESRGYRLYDSLSEDLVFVRKSSKYDPGYSAKLTTTTMRTLTEDEKQILMKGGKLF